MMCIKIVENSLSDYEVWIASQQIVKIIQLAVKLNLFLCLLKIFIRRYRCDGNISQINNNLWHKICIKLSSVWGLIGFLGILGGLMVHLFVPYRRQKVRGIKKIIYSRNSLTDDWFIIHKDYYLAQLIKLID